jgi:hypothetical protein
MAKQTEKTVHELLARGRSALGLSNREFGPLLGSSLRTAERWSTRRATPLPMDLERLARHVYAVDPALAAEIAAAAGATLESLGLEVRAPEPAPPTPPSPPPTPPAQLAELVVCAAAEALDVSPRVVRPALRTAFARARELGLDVETLEAALAPQVSTSPAPRTKQASKPKR